MSRQAKEVVSETIGAAIGTGFGLSLIGYGVFMLVTNSLETLF